jgi:glycosyltransferase involved in cell wall biosynthesis
MTAAPARRPKVAFISSRELDGQSIRRALSGWADLDSYRLPSVLTDFTVGRTVGAALAFLGSLLHPPVLPLQCALYADRRDLDDLVDRLPEDLDCAYVDGVRGYAFLQVLRRRRPGLRIVVDMDDLMSRRMDLLLTAQQPLSPGYLIKRLPRPLLRLIMSPLAGRMMVRYERAALQRVERRIAELADAVVLLSAVDAATLADRTHGRRAQIAVIPPARAMAVHTQPARTPRRFVFIGSDALTQNRMTIDYLLDFWARRKIETNLTLYGLSYRSLTLPPSVSAKGYVEDIEEIYDGQSVLLTPSLIGGGIKTKVLEAFAYGAPVIGNAVTFESMPIEDYPLIVDDEARLEALVRDPADHAQMFSRAARIGADYVRRRHDPGAFERRWRSLMIPWAAP